MNEKEKKLGKEKPNGHSFLACKKAIKTAKESKYLRHKESDLWRSFCSFVWVFKTFIDLTACWILNIWISIILFSKFSQHHSQKSFFAKYKNTCTSTFYKLLWILKPNQKTSDFGVVFLAFSVVFDGHGSLWDCYWVSSEGNNIYKNFFKQYKFRNKAKL